MTAPAMIECTSDDWLHHPITPRWGMTGHISDVSSTDPTSDVSSADPTSPVPIQPVSTDPTSGTGHISDVSDPTSDDWLRR
jgi:hypothetical protein